MKYAVLGSAGQVGQEFAKLLPAEDLILLPREQIDVTNGASVRNCLESVNCDVIVNLAAFHNVNACESDPIRSFLVNAVGAGYVAQAAQRTGCKIVYFSSDYVFGLDGDRRSPYTESDAIGPINVYGASKAAGEHVVRATTDNHLIVRSSSLFGVVTSRKGWTFPEMVLRRARAGEPLRMVDDQYMSPTYTLDLVRAVVRLVDNRACGTVHVTNAEGCTWFEFATTVLAVAGVDYAVEPVPSNTFPSAARRPSYSRLDSERLASLGVAPLRDWRDGLRAYLVEKGELEA